MMNDNYNPFVDCEAREYENKWVVYSMYWTIPMPNEGVARRVAEIIGFAYRAGKINNQNEIKKALGIPYE